MVDCATRYPEALPLRSAPAEAVARELLLLFSRVWIAKEILTDRGSCFMSRVLKELLSLQLKQLREPLCTTPIRTGLSKGLTKTPKQMLKKATGTGGKIGDQALPHVLFAVCKVPRASAGISPFELLYGRRPRGLLDLA